MAKEKSIEMAFRIAGNTPNLSSLLERLGIQDDKISAIGRNVETGLPLQILAKYRHGDLATGITRKIDAQLASGSVIFGSPLALCCASGSQLQP